MAGLRTWTGDTRTPRDDTRAWMDDTGGGGHKKGLGRETFGLDRAQAPLQCKFGGVLLSHNPSVAVPSALSGLASGFGMGPGVSLTLKPPKHCETRVVFQNRRVDA